MLLDKYEFRNSYAELGEGFGTYVKPDGFKSPIMVALNREFASKIGFDLSDERALLKLFSGNDIPEGVKPFSSVYSGHQFGGYTPQLGDGRAIMLGELGKDDNYRLEIQLKGAGLTPYSRMGDGRAVLRSVIREYLGSEAMYHLGIPTTRALSIVGSDHPVYRETIETGAMMARVAKSHIRFGHFEFFYHTKQYDKHKKLIEYIINRCFPHLLECENIYSAFLQEVVERTAKLIAMWQGVGFTHGVMNTDNMSIIGDTIDYGPYGFMDDYQSMYIPNHSDHQGRYAYASQPEIAMWNLKCLAYTFRDLIPEKEVLTILAQYSKIFNSTYCEIFSAKLGLLEYNDDVVDFIFYTLATLENYKSDYTRFFRTLSRFKGDHKLLGEFIPNRDNRIDWCKKYSKLLNMYGIDNNSREEVMKSKNPKYVLRNYMLQNAIELAEKGDYSEIEKLHKLIKKPFDEQPEFEQYAQCSPDWGKKLVISCSS